MEKLFSSEAQQGRKKRITTKATVLGLVPTHSQPKAELACAIWYNWRATSPVTSDH